MFLRVKIMFKHFNLIVYTRLQKKEISHLLLYGNIKEEEEPLEETGTDSTLLRLTVSAHEEDEILIETSTLSQSQPEEQWSPQLEEGSQFLAVEKLTEPGTSYQESQPEEQQESQREEESLWVVEHLNEPSTSYQEPQTEDQQRSQLGSQQEEESQLPARLPVILLETLSKSPTKDSTAKITDLLPEDEEEDSSVAVQSKSKLEPYQSQSNQPNPLLTILSPKLLHKLLLSTEKGKAIIEKAELGELSEAKQLQLAEIVANYHLSLNKKLQSDDLERYALTITTLFKSEKKVCTNTICK